MPATTTITAALRSRSVCVRMRWMPATPTSVRRATVLRSARAVTAASSAPGGGGGGNARSALLLRLVGEGAPAPPRRPRHSLRVPAEVLAKLERRLASVALQPEREARVLERGGEPLLGARVRPRGPAGHQVAGLREDPGIAERAASDHDPGAVRVRPHGHDVFRGGDVAVADHRNVEPLDHAGDLVPVRAA